MFYHLEGTVAELEPNFIVIDCGGVGFAVNTTANTAAAVTKGTRCRLYISEAVREDAFELYGFFTKTEKEYFEMLTAVSGIGPKAALSILSANTTDGLALAIASGNEKALTVAPGIGKKIAQRVILELKDKISRQSAFAGEIAAVPAGTPAPAESAAVNDAVAALTVLGYGSNEIAQALRATDTQGMSSEQIIKTVLRRMVK